MAAKLQFKFRNDTNGDDRQQLIAKLAASGAEVIEPLFPDATDAELAAFYSAWVSDDDRFRKLLRMLKRSRDVEFAEPQTERRLILPIGPPPRDGSPRKRAPR